MNLFSRSLRALRLYRSIARNPNTPTMVKVLPWLSILYIFWPLDVIPDVLPLLGQLDDIAIIPLLFYWAIRMAPDVIRKQAEKDVIDIDPVKQNPA